MSGSTDEPAASLVDVSKRYRRSEPLTVLEDVSLSLERGSYTAVMGPSGSGKSTLLHLLGCLDTPSEGTVRIAGKAVDEMSEPARARLRGEQVGFVFQAFNLMPRMTAAENVALPLVFREVPPEKRRSRARTLLDRVGLARRGDHRPSELSGGQRQRVAMARALANDPAVILADEPTGSLDTETGEQIMELFGDLHAAGRTILIVTHERRIAERAERIVHVLDGRVEEVEPLGDEVARSRGSPGR